MPRPRAGLRRRVAVLATAFVLAVTGLTVGQAAQGAPAAELPELAIDGTYVTGISSGGYMANQLQVAYSSRIDGAAVYAAGPYWCAMGNVAVALYACADSTLPRDLSLQYAKTAEYERDGKIDPTANLASMPTWLFHGSQDPTVKRPVADDLAAYYRHYGTPLTYQDGVDAGHGWISPLGPVDCAATAAPYINDCAPYDAQAESLEVMLGSVKAPNTGNPRGTVTEFFQDPYAVPPSLGVGDVTRTGAAAIGMGATGYLYTPATCTGGASCTVVVALHGCQQTAEQIGRTFVEQSNLNAYADTNRFVVLYPQARPDPLLGNPKGCWDWWGYLGPADVDYATKRGPQMATVMNMVTALGG
ncbi:poly(3-hydroxybutyrate) depolymerase [Geodermatophilus pulveris]|uniref:Poly(3-hydroxybutyrate) depolymerase n=1 Tax=Geodermatophilus pulveris TaxID=1564159 RepID=A0A239HDJ3_9ACTN|nr:PHB depolymerase family esterase [Geodermatophilus pulveris]SNS79352.1 poly(3-hydroxybutyrate) depolymerase [Geodermatophilus pulveris]